MFYDGLRAQTICCDLPKKGEDKSDRRVVKFMREKVGPFTYNYRFPILAAMLALSAGAIAAVAVLARPGQDFQVFEPFTPDAHRMMVEVSSNSSSTAQQRSAAAQRNALPSPFLTHPPPAHTPCFAGREVLLA